jgi:hypothetical protein
MGKRGLDSWGKWGIIAPACSPLNGLQTEPKGGRRSGRYVAVQLGGRMQHTVRLPFWILAIGA